MSGVADAPQGFMSRLESSMLAAWGTENIAAMVAVTPDKVTAGVRSKIVNAWMRQMSPNVSEQARQRQVSAALRISEAGETMPVWQSLTLARASMTLSAWIAALEVVVDEALALFAVPLDQPPRGVRMKWDRLRASLGQQAWDGKDWTVAWRRVLPKIELRNRLIHGPVVGLTSEIRSMSLDDLAKEVKELRTSLV